MIKKGLIVVLGFIGIIKKLCAIIACNTQNNVIKRIQLYFSAVTKIVDILIVIPLRYTGNKTI